MPPKDRSSKLALFGPSRCCFCRRNEVGCQFSLGLGPCISLHRWSSTTPLHMPASFYEGDLFGRFPLFQKQLLAHACRGSPRAESTPSVGGQKFQGFKCLQGCSGLWPGIPAGTVSLGHALLCHCQWGDASCRLEARPIGS